MNIGTTYISYDVVTDGCCPVLFSGAVVENQRKSVGFSPECSGEHKEYFHWGRLSISENLVFLDELDTNRLVHLDGRL